MHYLLVGGAPIDRLYLESQLNEEYDRIIGVDGGAQNLLDLGITPHILLGDFDSLAKQSLEEIGKKTEVRSFPEEKDWTDMELALDTAIHEGATRITIVGGIGDRWDHTIANIGLLYRALQAGVPAVMKAPEQEIRLLSPGQKHRMKREEGSEFSLLPMSGEVRGIRAWGVKYPLKNGTLRWGETLGVHNRISARIAHVINGDGYLILIRFQADQHN